MSGFEIISVVLTRDFLTYNRVTWIRHLATGKIVKPLYDDGMIAMLDVNYFT